MFDCSLQSQTQEKISSSSSPSRIIGIFDEKFVGGCKCVVCYFEKPTRHIRKRKRVSDLYKLKIQ